MERLGATHTANMSSENDIQHNNSSSITPFIKAKLIKLSEWFWLTGVSL
ncbi:MAG: hypothetical protein ACXWTR_06415 [Methylotenera sp.]